MSEFNSKKAIIFIISLVLITLGAIVTLLIIVTNIEKQIDPVRTIGERAIELAKTNAEIEAMQFFAEESAKITAEKAIIKFRENAGLRNTQECGILNFEDQNYVYWNSPQNPDKKCFETDFYQNYQFFFNTNFAEYLNLLADTEQKKMPLTNYDLFMRDGKELSGIPSKPIKFTLYAPKETMKIKSFLGHTDEEISQGAIATYSAKLPFTIPFRYDFTILNTARKFVRAVLDDITGCKDKIKEDALICISEKANEQKILITKKIQSDTFMINIEGKFPIKIALLMPTKSTQQ